MNEQVVEDKPQKPLKRKLNKDGNSEKSPKNVGQKKDVKKSKLFSAKEFRKKLGQNDKSSAIKQFLEALRSKDNHDYIFDYLENGGNCLELLQVMENDSTMPPSLIFELVTHLLLKISTMYTQYENSTYEACRYLINNFISVVHKMLGLSSSKEERKACLKLLTAMVTFSSTLAKDVLLNVKFHSANIELLTKHTQEKNSVRDYFIHFLTAFLVDGHEHILTVLLERGGLLTSIISGLQYDQADTVCIVITAMKNHILENSKVSRTMKMSVFNTSVIRDIVNLYNWRGPDGLKMLEKNNKAIFEVDKYEKSKVGECVHDFLVVLCTSHKFGVIFKDPLVGLGRKNQNALIYTVLESLAKPWEHSYASDLVLKICKACPDLTKTTWSNLKTFLEPRLSEKWITTLNFAKKLLESLDPHCIDHCAKDLSAQQLAQVIELLVSPLPILKTLLPENYQYEDPSIKKHILLFLKDMLTAIQNFLEAAKTWSDADNYKKVKNHLAAYVLKNFPSALVLLNDWNELSQDSDDTYEYLNSIFDVLGIYQTISPQLVYNISPTDLNVKELLQNFDSSNEENELLQIKIVNLFLELDQTYFSPKNETFGCIFPLLLRLYHKLKSKDILKVLAKFLKNTGIFEGSLGEINIWCDGFLNLESYSDNLAEKLTNIIKTTHNNLLEYQGEISNIPVDHLAVPNVNIILENLLNMDENSDFTKVPRHTQLSPFLLGILKDLAENGCSKSFKKYLEFSLPTLLHLQTDLSKFQKIIETYKENIPINILQYIETWCSGGAAPLYKLKVMSSFQTFSEEFLTSKINQSLLNESPCVSFKQDLLITSIFYFSNLLKSSCTLENHVENFKIVVKSLNAQAELNDDSFEYLLGNPNFIKYFDILHLNKSDSSGICIKAIYEIVKELKSSDRNINQFLKNYSEKIYQSVFKVIKKPAKYAYSSELLDLLNVFQLSYNQISNIVSKITENLDSNIDITENILFHVFCYCLNRIYELSEQKYDIKPLEKKELHLMTSYFGQLAKNNKHINKFSRSFKNYLTVFPHSIADLEKSFFSSLLEINEYDEDNVNLLVFLLERNPDFANEFSKQVGDLSDKKRVLFPLANVLINNNMESKDLLEDIYKILEPSILKALKKPQKVGQHFQKDYDIPVLVENYMEYEKCKSFVEKVQKFEVSEIFHVRLLKAVFKTVFKHDLSEKYVGNIILTLVHLGMTLFKRKSKNNDDNVKFDKFFNIFCDTLDTIQESSFNSELKNIVKNESLKTFTKFCLKHGVSSQFRLLKCLRSLVQLLIRGLEKEDASLILEMLLSHSEFLDTVLSEHSETKLEVLCLHLILCKTWPDLMEKNHVPVLLSAYRGKITKCDRTILEILKLYELKADQTRFYDFKPFLWGRAAATHYSVRSQIEYALIRQPKTNDVLDLIKEDLVRTTITSYPLTESFDEKENKTEDIKDKHCYDLKFMLPLFSHLLAPEQQVKTYKFTRSGALSLTVIGLSSNAKEVRQAACHVLSRFHFHLEARQTGKDNLLWIRYVEALCKGVSVLANFKINNFAAIFFARMALVFTQPNHVMYQPLARYLSAKSELQLDTIPELYTLLHSSEVNFKEHRNFILGILRDGLRTEQDFKHFEKSMAFKLFSELFVSCLSDHETKLLILDVIKSACKFPLGVKVLSENYGLTCQIISNFTAILNETKPSTNIIAKYIDLCLQIVNINSNIGKEFFNTIYTFVNHNLFTQVKSDIVSKCYEILYKIFVAFPGKITTEILISIINRSDDKSCKYFYHYGTTVTTEINLVSENNVNYFLQKLTLCFLKCNKIA